jgi:hypothetical protein
MTTNRFFTVNFDDNFTPLAFPDITFYQYYGVLILGLLLLLLSSLVFICRTSVLIFLNGVSLIAIGLIWEFYLALGTFGAILKDLNAFVFAIALIPCVILVIFGFKKLFQFFRMLKWDKVYLSRSETEEVKSNLKKFVCLSENKEDGIVKTEKKAPEILLGYNIADTAIYTGKLLTDNSLMISDKLNNCFIINRKKMSNSTFNEFGSVKIKGLKRFEATPISVVLFKQWSDKQLNVADIKRLSKSNVEYFSILKPFLHSEDIHLRDTAIEILPKLPEGDVISLLNEPVSTVTALL